MVPNKDLSGVSRMSRIIRWLVVNTLVSGIFNIGTVMPRANGPERRPREQLKIKSPECIIDQHQLAWRITRLPARTGAKVAVPISPQLAGKSPLSLPLK